MISKGPESSPPAPTAGSLAKQVALFLFALLCLISGIGLADSNSFERRVSIAHHPPGLQDTSGQDWCARHRQDIATDMCSEQNDRLNLAADWNEIAVYFMRLPRIGGVA